MFQYIFSFIYNPCLPIYSIYSIDMYDIKYVLSVDVVNQYIKYIKTTFYFNFDLCQAFKQLGNIIKIERKKAAN